MQQCQAGRRAHLRILRRVEPLDPDCQPVLVLLAGYPAELEHAFGQVWLLKRRPARRRLARLAPIV